jgi:phage anti-repressor protein
MHAYRILLPSETDDSRFNSREKHMLTDSVQPYNKPIREREREEKFIKIYTSQSGDWITCQLQSNLKPTYTNYYACNTKTYIRISNIDMYELY